MRRELTAVEKRGGALYGTCPKGHGDENGRIAAEVSADRRPFPNCPICAASLSNVIEAWERTALLQTISDQARDLSDVDADVTCPCGKELPVTETFRCFECEVYFCPPCAEEHFGMEA